MTTSSRNRMLIAETVSLCPECLKRVSAHKVSENGNIYLEKECVHHGRFKTLIWRGNTKQYLDWGSYGVAPVPPFERSSYLNKGCPYDCGLCPSHKANTCSMIVLVTSRCNISCPVCLAGSEPPSWDDPDIKTIERMYDTVLKTAGTPSIQLSGGEPTVRDDLPEIVALGKKRGFQHLVINSNGVRIAKDKTYLQKLAQAGAGTIYLQFDGLTDDVYRHSRGAHLLDLKIKAINNCRDVQIGVILVPTLIPMHNDDQLGAIIAFAKKWVPTIRGVHFQPISYFGRYPGTPKDKDRITLPEVIDHLVSQTNGELSHDDFFPRRSKSSYCAFSGLFVLRDGQLKPMSSRPKGKALPLSGRCSKPPWESARSFMELHWQLQENNMLPVEKPTNPLDKMCHEVATRGLAISCMPFQDAWNIDLERLSSCCLHVIDPNLKIVPFCAYYLTDVSGKRLLTK